MFFYWNSILFFKKKFFLILLRNGKLSTKYPFLIFPTDKKNFIFEISFQAQICREVGTLKGKIYEKIIAHLFTDPNTCFSRMVYSKLNIIPHPRVGFYEFDHCSKEEMIEYIDGKQFDKILVVRDNQIGEKKPEFDIDVLVPLDPDEHDGGANLLGQVKNVLHPKANDFNDFVNKARTHQKKRSQDFYLYVSKIHFQHKIPEDLKEKLLVFSGEELVKILNQDFPDITTQQIDQISSVDSEETTCQEIFARVFETGLDEFIKQVNEIKQRLEKKRKRDPEQEVQGTETSDIESPKKISKKERLNFNYFFIYSFI